LGLDHDVAYQGLEHLRRDTDMALEQFAELPEGGDDVLLSDARRPWPPAGLLELLQPIPLGSELPAHLLGLGDDSVEVRSIH
jgi:hypothetical protein